MPWNERPKSLPFREIQATTLGRDRRVGKDWPTPPVETRCVLCWGVRSNQVYAAHLIRPIGPAAGAGRRPRESFVSRRCVIPAGAKPQHGARETVGRDDRARAESIGLRAEAR